MRRLVILLALAGCGHGKSPGGVSPDAAGDPAACMAAFQETVNTDKTCTSPSDCVLVNHDDCCGTVRMAVREGTEASFAAAETQLHMCFDCGGRGCAHQDEAEDNRVPQAGQSIVVQCNAAHRCMSTVQ